MPPSSIDQPNYDAFLTAIKDRVRVARQRALAAANEELLRGYWEIGHEILRRQEQEGWGAKVIDRLATDLRTAFPGSRGFSSRSLKYMRQFAAAWPKGPFVQSGLAQIAWTHHIALLEKLDDPHLRAWYGEKAAENGWSRDVLVYQIDGQLHLRKGQALTNFERALPGQDSDLARELNKSPYLFEWLGLDDQAAEAEVERGLVAQVERFLLELGEGFALIGRQHPLKVSGNEYRIDLLLYQLQLRCYVVIELKVGPFKPEYVGKLGFYLAAVDDLVAGERDNPTIGLVLCKGADETIAEYTLRDSTAPIPSGDAHRRHPLQTAPGGSSGLPGARSRRRVRSANATAASSATAVPTSSATGGPSSSGAVTRRAVVPSGPRTLTRTGYAWTSCELGTRAIPS
jgi:predicted nuclease of restriction endonuclease-like (RecB) superfamily